MENLISKIKALREEESIKVYYRGNPYHIQCTLKFSSGEQLLAIVDKNRIGSYKVMNFEKITDKYIHLYFYDMFDNRQITKIKINELYDFNLENIKPKDSPINDGWRDI